MVDFLKQWVLGVCAAALFCSVIFALVPNENMKKSVRLICAAVIISSMILPFSNGLPNLNIKRDFEYSQELNASQSESLYNFSAILNDEIAAKIDDILTESGYQNCEINVSIKADGNDSITIGRIDIRAPDNKKIDENTKTKIYKAVGEDTLIVFS